jgi:preprotein translocase subunit SecA
VPPEEFDAEPIEERRARLHELAHAFLRRELTELERMVLLQIFDTAWKDHLYAMDQLRDSIGLRGIAQRDPVVEYKREGSRLFETFLQVLRDKVTDVIFRVQIASGDDMRDVYSRQEAQFDAHEAYGVEAAAAGAPGEPLPAADEDDEEEEKVATIVNLQPKVGRNNPCPCGSGKKYKHCCGRQA